MQTEIVVGKVIKLRLPAKYFNKDASKEDKEVFEVYKAKAEILVKEGVGVIVFPAVRDDQGNPLFDIEIL